MRSGNRGLIVVVIVILGILFLCPVLGLISLIVRIAGRGLVLGIGGAFGLMFMLLFLVLIVVAIIYLVRWANREGEPFGISGPPAGRESALDILNKRYARGEITKEQYEQMKKDLLM